MQQRHIPTWLKNKRPTWCQLLFHFTSYVFNMFRTLIYPSSGAYDTANREQNDRCDNSTVQSQSPDDGYIKYGQSFLFLIWEKWQLAPNTWLKSSWCVKNLDIKQYTSNTTFIVWSLYVSTLYRAIIRPSLESIQWLLRTCWDPNYGYKT